MSNQSSQDAALRAQGSSARSDFSAQRGGNGTKRYRDGALEPKIGYSAERPERSSLSSYRTAESVSPKHPDKLCDQISDAILDAYLAGDPASRVAIETVGGHGKVFITGEVTSTVHPA
ncbi:S-adenosylmethionine synthetase N-terminal domain-containing protein, partial [Klebsiella pneumoniae]